MFEECGRIPPGVIVASSSSARQVSRLTHSHHLLTLPLFNACLSVRVCVNVRVSMCGVRVGVCGECWNDAVLVFVVCVPLCVACRVFVFRRVCSSFSRYVRLAVCACVYGRV